MIRITKLTCSPPFTASHMLGISNVLIVDGTPLEAVMQKQQKNLLSSPQL